MAFSSLLTFGFIQHLWCCWVFICPCEFKSGLNFTKRNNGQMFEVTCVKCTITHSSSEIIKNLF